eukprot:Nk52_evm71s2118 gene=Nk52_evmTU71s2118
MAFMLDLCFNFRTGVIKFGIVEDDVKKIRLAYVQENLFSDLLASCPLDTIYLLIRTLAHQLDFFEHNFDLFAFHIMYSTTFHSVLRIPRLIRLRRWQDYFNNMQGFIPNKVSDVIELCANILLIWYWVGCIYFVIVELEGFAGNNWLPGEEFAHMSVTQQALRSFYWAFSTTTGIADTGAVPETSMEILFTVLVGILGISVYATIIGKVGAIIASVNSANEEFRQKMQSLNNYMEYRRIPRDIRNRVRRYFDFLHSRQQGHDDEKILRDFPMHLRTEIYKHLCKDIVRKVPIFKHASTEFINNLVVSLKPQLYSPGDFIIRVNDVAREMFFISCGTVDILDSSGRTISKLGVGDFFGEMEIMPGNNSHRVASVIAVQFCDIFALRKKDLDRILEEFPEDAASLQKVAEDRLMMSKVTLGLGLRKQSVDESSEKTPVKQWGKELRGLYERIVPEYLTGADFCSLRDTINLLQSKIQRAEKESGNGGAEEGPSISAVASNLEAEIVNAPSSVSEALIQGFISLGNKSPRVRTNVEDKTGSNHSLASASQLLHSTKSLAKFNSKTSTLQVPKMNSRRISTRPPTTDSDDMSALEGRISEEEGSFEEDEGNLSDERGYQKLPGTVTPNCTPNIRSPADSGDEEYT